MRSSVKCFCIFAIMLLLGKIQLPTASESEQVGSSHARLEELEARLAKVQIDCRLRWSHKLGGMFVQDEGEVASGHWQHLFDDDIETCATLEANSTEIEPKFTFIFPYRAFLHHFDVYIKDTAASQSESYMRINIQRDLVNSTDCGGFHARPSGWKSIACPPSSTLAFAKTASLYVGGNIQLEVCSIDPSGYYV